jgi:hypothetical protein
LLIFLSIMMKFHLVFLFLLLSLGFAEAKSLLSALNEPGLITDISLEASHVQEGPTDEAELSKINGLVSERLKAIRKSRMVYSWNVASPRDKTANYCIDQCGCINRELVEILKFQYPVRSLTVRAKRGFMDVTLRNNQGGFANYDYHVVTIIKVRNKWFVIDPVGSLMSQAESLEDWMQRLERPERLIGRVI